MKHWAVLSAGFVLAIAFHLLLGMTVWNFVIYAALPGLVVHLLITGGHGGTIMEERLGSILEVAVNTGFYAALLWASSVLLRKLRPSKISN
jgi:hypothetical protein